MREPRASSSLPLAPATFNNLPVRFTYTQSSVTGSLTYECLHPKANASQRIIHDRNVIAVIALEAARTQSFHIIHLLPPYMATMKQPAATDRISQDLATNLPPAFLDRHAILELPPYLTPLLSNPESASFRILLSPQARSAWESIVEPTLAAMGWPAGTYDLDAIVGNTKAESLLGSVVAQEAERGIKQILLLVGESSALAGIAQAIRGNGRRPRDRHTGTRYRAPCVGLIRASDSEDKQVSGDCKDQQLIRDLRIFLHGR